MTLRLFHVLLTLLCLVAGAMPATATIFTMERGLNLDPWLTWPTPERWDDEAVLGNFPEWRRNIRADDLEAIRNAGFDFVRMPVDPAIFLENASEQRVTRLIAETLKSINMLQRAGLKVIVDLHSIPTEQRQIGTHQVLADPLLFARYVDLVGRLGRAMAITDPALTAFELFNEPVLDCDLAVHPKWPPLLWRLHAAARQALPKHTLVLSGGCWSSAYGLSQINPTAVGDDNVIWTFHSYEPFILTHQGAGWTGDAMAYVEGLPYPPDRLGAATLNKAMDTTRVRINRLAPEADRQRLLDNFDDMVQGVTSDAKALAILHEPFEEAAVWGRQYKIPPERIFLGEFGMVRQAYGNDFRLPSEWRASYLKHMVAAARTHGFPWSVWSWEGTFGITLGDERHVFDLIVMEGLKTN